VKFSLVLSQDAKKDLGKLDKRTLVRLNRRFEELALAPYDFRLSKLLVMGQGERSSRVGDWRIIFTIRAEEKMVYIFSIEHRREAYKK